MPLPQEDENRHKLTAAISAVFLTLLNLGINFLLSVAFSTKNSYLKSADAVKIQAEDLILIHLDEEITFVHARVRIVELSAFTKVSALGVEEQRVNIIGDFVDASAGFGDGYRVDTRIVIWQHSNIVKVPLSALFRCQQQWCVFRVKGDRAQRQVVEVGQRPADDLETDAREIFTDDYYPTLSNSIKKATIAISSKSTRLNRTLCSVEKPMPIAFRDCALS